MSNILYPIIDKESGVRLHDEELCACLEADFAEDITVDGVVVYGARVWDEMSELDRIDAQLSHIAPMPRMDSSPEALAFNEAQDDYLDKKCLELLKECKRLRGEI